jgi:hypothetical protein
MVVIAELSNSIIQNRGVLPSLLVLKTLVNRYRQLAHLDPVVEDTDLSHADRSHAQYLVSASSRLPLSGLVD